jgi:iron only hydrogenase large subunit-like protein
MGAGITGDSEVDDTQFMSFSGVPNVERALKDIPKWNPDHGMFLELNACAGSCINGPGAAANSSIARRRYDVVRSAKACGNSPRELSLNIACSYAASPVDRNKYSELTLREAL